MLVDDQTFWQTLRDLERRVRRGEMRTAGVILMKLCRRRIPRECLPWTAQLCWRAGLPELGLRILKGQVRTSRRSPAQPRTAESAEYAACLIKAGAVEEAADLLESIPATDYPRVWLYRAFVCVARWGYRDSVDKLKRYLRSETDRYGRLVGKANLAAAYVFIGDRLRSQAVLREVVHDASVQGLHLILARGLELLTIEALQRNRFADAERYLDRAELLLKDAENVDRFLLEKWRSVREFLQFPKDRSARQKLENLRAQAARRRHWETVRDCDRIEALATGDENLLRKVYFGTPFSVFRDAMLKEQIVRQLDLSTGYVWRTSDEIRTHVDVATGLVRETDRKLFKVGMADHRLFSLFVADFYRPLSVASLHAGLFVGEYYNPESSPLRVRKAIHRLREKLKKAGVPIRIEERDGSYGLRLGEGVAIRVATENPSGRDTWPLEQLRTKFGMATFSASEATRFLGISARSVQRLLGTGYREGRLRRQGAGSRVRYVFA